MIRYSPPLDGLRGIAILLVLVHHFTILQPITALDRAIVDILIAGWSGVDLFFVLSGFLITSILLVSRDGPQYFRSFYGRRVLRIFPLYYTSLLIGLVLLPLMVPAMRLALDTSGHLWLWTYTLNIGFALGLIASPVAFFSHFWTLAIEEQFYLVWPWLVKVLSARVLLVLCGLIMVASLLMRLVWVGLGFGWEGAYRFTLTRADSLAIGAGVAVLMRYTSWRRTLLKLAPGGFCAGLAALALMFLSVPRFYPSEWVVVTFGHSVIAFASAWLIVLALRQRSGTWLAGRSLRALGKYSYGIYVLHFPLQRVLLGWYGTRPSEPSSAALLDAFAFLLIGLSGSVLLGWVSYHVIERPFLRLKRFFAYSRDGSLGERLSPETVLASPVR